MMKDKRVTLSEAIEPISDGSRLALGGNTLHRGPCAAVHEIVRQGKRHLELVKTAGAYDIDLLAGTGCASSASVGFVGFETVFGMAPSYRRAVERGDLETKEHACYSVIAGLRAAIQGVPFMPINGFAGSDLPQARGFRSVVDPYEGREVVVIPALIPDIAIIHVQEADAEGNGRIIGTRFEDVLMAQAATRVILTAERIVDGASFESIPEQVAIPSFLVNSVVEAPNGAWPTSCTDFYDYDAAFLAAYVEASRNEATLRAFVEEYILSTALAGATS
jgi:glutaconate CoA-transferase subunit A